ncbi:hypothetical protein FLAN108750_03015 [Flavobacterium antarcticum]|uniref:hypothetical protein n=1 Tax=Flavobacterium antarcticum TaxID=271155 RepID=UPI0003B57B10|nr:hypothetical protein [Flavobacterium antarcticum]
MELYQKSFENFKESYIAFSTLAVIGQSCLGSIAAMYILSNGTNPLQMIQLAILVIICMSVNTAILAQLTPKTVFNLIITTVISSVFFIIVNTLII